MDRVIKTLAVRAMNDCIEHSTGLFLTWREEMWPDPETDPILLENRALGRRDWREVILKPRGYERPIFDDAIYKGRIIV